MTQNEWLAGRYTLPTEVRDEGVMVRPEIILWLELPAAVIVQTTINTPRERISAAQSFAMATENPGQGSPRRPARIRVSAGALAKELDGCGVPVVVAPVPELDAAFADLTSALFAHHGQEEEPSYFGDGSISETVVATLFDAAGLLVRAAPWRHVAEYQVVRVDIAALEVEGACLSVIGGGGESYGLLLFRSLDVYETFVRGGAQPRPGTGTNAFISLSFDRKKDLPPRMTREIAKHRWNVAGAKAYPVLLAIDDGMNPIVVTERDYRIAIAMTLAFLSFFEQSGDLFAMDEPDVVCASYAVDDGVTVTFTAPYGDALFDSDGDPGDDFDEPIRATREPRIGRNDPCPCGSGKKYKKCHLGADQPWPGTRP